MPDGIQIQGPMHEGFAEVLSEEAQKFIVQLHRQFNGRRQELLKRRKKYNRRSSMDKSPAIQKRLDPFVRETGESHHCQMTYKIDVARSLVLSKPR